MALAFRPQAVLFDLDGTLIDSERMVREAYFAASARFGRAMTAAEFNSLVGLNREANDAQILAMYGEDFPLEHFYAAAREKIGGRAAPLKPGAREILETLDALRLRYGIVTSSAHDWVARHVEAHGLAGRFATIIARGDYARAKPDPEPYLAAAAALGAAPAQSLAIEDSHIGVRAAHSAGMAAIMTPDLLAPDDEMREKTVAILESLHDVRALLAALS